MINSLKLNTNQNISCFVNTFSVFCRTHLYFHIYFEQINVLDLPKFCGLIISKNIKWVKHLNKLYRKTSHVI